MTKKIEIAPEQMTFMDLGPEALPHEVVRSYDFSATDTFPSAEAAHEQKEERLSDSAEKQGFNPVALEIDRDVAFMSRSPRSTTPAKEAQIEEARKRRNQRGRPRRDPDYGAEPWSLR